MATGALHGGTSQWNVANRAPADSTLAAAVRTALKPVASLKLTVVLFLLAIFLIFAGTLTQARHDVLWVQDHYFFTPLAWIEFKTFFPPAWFSDSPWLLNLPGSFPFPGGFTIGGLMAVNLLAAHGLRFKVQTRGLRLWSGLGVIALGCLVVWLVVDAGPGKDGSQASAPTDWITLWKVFLGALACACVGVAVAVFQIDSRRKLERGVLSGVGVALLILLGFLLFHVDAQDLNPSAMRILWQLLEGEFAAAVLLVGCILAFRKRAGIVLLHAGIGLIMVNQLVVYCLHKEEQLRMAEGQTVNYASDIRTVELAVIDKKSSATEDDVTVIPEKMLRDSLDGKKPISDRQLPFDVQQLDYFENSALRKAGPEEKTVADAGIGKIAMIERLRPVTGASAGEGVNLPAAYVQLTEKGTGKSLGTYLVSTGYVDRLGNSVEQKAQVADKEYEIALRFQREYKPYTMHLHEVRGDMYLGTKIPRNYSSDLQLVDPTRGVDRRADVRMNEPLRYGGETFYQAGFDDGQESGTGVKATTLQVVSNFGWMIPYLACMIVATGLLAHFCLTLVRFLRRREEGPTAAQRAAVSQATARPGIVLPSVVAALAIGLLAYLAIVPSAGPKEFDFYNFGKLPVMSGGRVQPLDSLARNLLRVFCLREAYLDQSGVQLKPAKEGQEGLEIASVIPGSAADLAGIKPGDRLLSLDRVSKGDFNFKTAWERLEDNGNATVKAMVARGDQPARGIVIKREFQPAVKWLLEVAARPDVADRLHVFKVENLDLLNLLGLRRREYYRYSWDEIYQPKLLEKEFQELRDSKSDNYSVFQKKLSELQSRMTLYLVLRGSFMNHPLPPFPTDEESKADPDGTDKIKAEIKERLIDLAQTLQAMMDPQAESHPPLAVPTPQSREMPSADQPTQAAPASWEPYTLAWLQNYFAELRQQPPNPAATSLAHIFDAYAQQDAGAFNRAVVDYSMSLSENPPRQMEKAVPAFEAWFNHWSPFFDCQWLYFAAFCLVAFSWLGKTRTLNRTAFWLIAVTFLVHTFALVARMYISGRPPVINLYSTAIFIGWAAVLAGLILESVYHLSFGNAVASIAGFVTLLLADRLTLLLEPSSGGDTISVMQAVLDTQFWLATHVTMVNLGYSATYVAGLLGLIYVVRGLFTTSLTASDGKDLARMIYGTVCFAIFFSFVGTVLGGLWADDSWGRFWGWDPKENGALIIVLWNALVLHARWDGLVKDRGLALLAIGGNIVVSWSYFGVNQLGVGLHSYGFTEGVLLALALVCVSQLAMIALGLTPLRFWRSNHQPPAAPA
ncbi:MAG TPA: cytochrome c biogenesis protein CcsA [Pirellulales bacterium]|jgi:ABC-type transport system involved in cytochrome c biogenesis permease subunit|nr:cytochrome c biogenesis protein CcsA [Pirellulales bacterium]